ncbi:MAG TPA: surface-adhesin E family protein, partial [Longimicrobium sp.]
MIVPALAGLFLAAPLSGQGARFADTTQWRALGGNDEIEQYVDVATVRATGEKMVQISVGWLYKSVQSASGRPYDSRVALWEVDCAQRRMRVLRYTTHFRDATLSRDTEPTDWIVPSPTAMTASVVRVVCYRAWAREDSVATPLSGQAAQFADTTKWWPLGGNDEVDQYVDAASVRATGDKMAQVSVGWLFKQAQSTSAGNPYDSTVALWEVDCGRRRMRVLTLSTHFRDNTLFTDTQPTEWIMPSPTATTFPVMRVVCQGVWAGE